MGTRLCAAVAVAAVIGVGPSNPAPAQSEAPVLSFFLQQADFWASRGRPDLVRDTLSRALQIAPDDPEILYRIGVASFESGDTATGAAMLAQLRTVAPNDPRIARLQRAEQVAAAPAISVEEPRRLAREGARRAAADAYEKVFGGTDPPDRYAREYYETLAGTPDRWQRGLQGLADRIARNPADVETQSTYARLLTYRSQSREEGFERLMALAQHETVGAEARQAWRTALFWVGSRPEDWVWIQRYLALVPNDDEMRRYLDKVVAAARQDADRIATAPQDSSDPLRGDLRSAETLYGRRLADDQGDVEARIGLGIVRLRQGRFGEAEQLLARAAKEAPGKRAAWGRPLASARYWGTVARARDLINRGQFQDAAHSLTAIVGSPEDPNEEARLLQAAALKGLRRWSEAIAAYKRVLSRHPKRLEAKTGLVDALNQAGRVEEAKALVRDLETAAATDRSGSARRLLAQTHRAQAEAAEARGALDQADEAYRAALEGDPDDPWLRLAYARLLTRTGRPTVGRTLLTGLTERPTVAPAAWHVLALYETDQQNWAAAAAALEQIPAARRTADVKQLAADVGFKAELAGARALAEAGQRQEALARLAALEKSAGNGAARQRMVAGAYAELDAPEESLAILSRLNRAGTTQLTPDDQLIQASVLARNGRHEEAEAIARRLLVGHASPGSRANAQRLLTSLAIGRSDRLLREGKIQEAYHLIAPLAEKEPGNAGLASALARIYEHNKQPAEALTVYQSILDGDPNNNEANRGAVGAALGIGAYRQALGYAEAALAGAPDDPELHYLRGEAARAAGDTGVAVAAFERARALRLTQLGQAPSTPAALRRPTAGTAPDRLPPPARRTNPPAGPRSDAGIAPADPANWLFGAILSSPPSTPPQHTPDAQTPPRSLVAVPTPAPRPTQFEQTGIAAGEPMEEPAATAPRAAATRGDFDLAGLVAPARPSPVAPDAGPGQGWLAGLGTPKARAMDDVLYADLPPKRPPPELGTEHAAVPRPLPPPNASVRADAEGAEMANAVSDDPLLQRIDRSLADLRTEVVSYVEAGPSVRLRSGESGFSKVTEFGLPATGSFAPGNTGRLTIGVTPVTISAGDMEQSKATQQRFGTLALAPAGTAPAALDPGEQRASGVGAAVSYEFKSLKAEVGTTPIGFPKTSITGGLTWSPRLSDSTSARVRVGRQPVTDSVLSYAGTEDSRTGTSWGGVTRTGGDVLMSYEGQRIGGFVGAGYHLYDGSNVASNSAVNALLGGYARFPIDTESEWRAGVNVMYQSFDQNLRNFTFGQGGYFSPQSYASLAFPVSYRHKSDRWLIEGEIAPAIQTFTEDDSVYYPTDSALQRELERRAAADTTLSSVHKGQSVTGFAIGGRGRIEYKLTDGLIGGAAVGFDKSGDFNEGVGRIYLRKTFN